MMVQSKPHIMQPFDLHPEFYNQPIWLTEEEKLQPMIVIKQFFEDVKLIEVKQLLSSLLEVALTRSNTIYDEASERDAVLCFCKRLEKMTEAANVIAIL